MGGFCYGFYARTLPAGVRHPVRASSRYFILASYTPFSAGKGLAVRRRSFLYIKRDLWLTVVKIVRVLVGSFAWLQVILCVGSR